MYMNIGLWTLYIPILLLSDVIKVALVRKLNQEKKKISKTRSLQGKIVIEFP